MDALCEVKSPLLEEDEEPTTCAASMLDMSCAGVPWGTKVIAWDTETSGLVGAVVQLGVVGRGDEGETFSYSTNVKLASPYRMEPKAEALHGLSEERVNSTGCDPSIALARMAEIVSVAKTRGIPLVAHNAAFDKKSIARTAVAAKVADPLHGAEVACTMQLGRCVKRRLEGKNVAPTNVWLFETLCGTLPHGVSLHDATDDARLTAQSYLAGIKDGYW